MAKLERVNQLIFANNAGSREVTSFGTAKNQDPTYTRDVAAIQNSNYLQGWNSAVLPDKAPYMEDSNALYYAVTRQLAYLFQAGLPEWNAETTYYQNSFVQVNGAIYYSLVNDNTGYNPTTNPTYWADFWGTVKTDIATLNTNIAALNKSITDLNNNKANTGLNNLSQAGINYIMQAVMPDWSKAVTQGAGSHTASQFGWLQAQGATGQNAIGLQINGVWVAYTEAYGSRDTSGYACLVPVFTGDTYWCSNTIRFIPCYGER